MAGLDVYKRQTLLTTDGYWNGPAGLKVDGSAINNQDATPTPFPKREGNVTTTGGSHTNTLADVAAYYYNTDIRNAITFGPVSYTHLDVYKRQVLTTPSAQTTCVSGILVQSLYCQ